MKTRTLIAIIYSLMFAATASWLLLEQRACAQIRHENGRLLRRLNEATEKLAENQRLPPSKPRIIQFQPRHAMTPPHAHRFRIRAKSRLGFQRGAPQRKPLAT